MSIRVNRNLSLKERKVYTFGDFRGVDFSTSPYLVAKNRAISAQNLIYENGTVRKRTGWKSLCKLPGKINGLFSFEIENEAITLVYAGKRFYKLIWNEKLGKYNYSDITASCTYKYAEIDQTKLVERRVQLYVNKNKAYIVGCGDYLVFGKWGGSFELRRVFNNEDTYIPTTTINIDKDGVNDENRATLDGVNLLSSFRINEFLGSDTNAATWSVDTAIDGVEQAINADSDVNITLYTLDDSNAPISYEINNRIASDKSLLYAAGDDINSVGSVNFATGKITLNINTKPQEADTSNIKVKFQKGDSSQADIIYNSTISSLFGGNGNSNRLFVSGDAANKNVHVWSEMYDFTYFADNNHDEIGSDSSAIMGYVRATDGILLVFKEKNGSDSTIYYVSGTDTQETDYAGNLSFVTLFTKTAGNVADTIFGKYATASLNGDNLILTRNGVKGLELYENLTTSAYRIRERSRNINAKLLAEANLEEASAVVYKDKYYLSVNGVVYVCDSRFAFSAEEDISDSHNYEWWYFTNVDARVWAEINNELYFGTNDGKICKFTEEEFADITYQDSEAGDISINYADNKIVYNMELDKALNESSNLTFTQGDVYSLYIDSSEIKSVDADGFLYVDENLLYKIYEGVTCLADRVENTGLQIDKEYHINSVDLDNLRFTLADSNNNLVIPSAVGFRLCKKISSKTLYVTNIDTAKNEFQVKEYPGGGVLDLVIYNYTMSSELLATITFKDNVVAKWYTPIYDLGSNMYSKTLLGITITTEPLVKGAISIGYQTRNIEKDFITHGSRGFDFNDIDFEDFSFESSFTNSNTLRVKERNFNFIILRYISDTQTACAVNGITIRYKINRLNKGVR